MKINSIVAGVFTFCILASCESVDEKMKSTITVQRINGASLEPIVLDKEMPIFVDDSNRLHCYDSVSKSSPHNLGYYKRRVWFDLKEVNGAEVKEIVYMINPAKGTSVHQSFTDPYQISVVVSQLNGDLFLHEQQNPYAGYSVQMGRSYKLRIHTSYFDKNDKFVAEKISPYILVTIRDSNR